MSFSDFDSQCMKRALELAARGEGRVEPNPLVGCVVASDGEIFGEGWHEQFGGPHAEIAALRAAGDRARGADLYVTLEPCCHHGKTPPCTQAIIAAGIARVVVAQPDPFPQVDGGGIALLQQAGIALETGLLQSEAETLCAPYRKLVAADRPWVIAKWAMSLDGKIATRAGDSQWISNEQSRAVVHQLRGRVDAVIVGRGTAEADDPLLTARPAGLRTAARIVLDSRAALSLDSQLVKTSRQAPVLVAAGPQASSASEARLRDAGCEVLVLPDESFPRRLELLLDELGRRRMTNVLVEGGARVLGVLCDARLIDEIHLFIAPKLIGGEAAPSAIGGAGVEFISNAAMLKDVSMEELSGDVHIWGRFE